MTNELKNAIGKVDWKTVSNWNNATETGFYKLGTNQIGIVMGGDKNSNNTNFLQVIFSPDSVKIRGGFSYGGTANWTDWYVINKNVQTDWNETDTSSDAYIKNKPTIPSVGNGTVTIKQAGMQKGTFTMNQSGNTTIELADNNTTYGIVSKAANGLAPRLPNETTTTKYLRQDGTWAIPPNTTYATATQSSNGLMSASDKKKLDGVADNANNYTHLTTTGNRHIPSGGSS